MNPTSDALKREALASGPNFWQRAAVRLLDMLWVRIARGRLVVGLPDGTTRSYGDPATGPTAAMQVHRWEFFPRVVTGADVGFGEAYVEGEWDADDPAAVLGLLGENMHLLRERSLLSSRPAQLFNRLFHLRRSNTKAGSRRNISAHYDLSNEFYALWLDPSMMYSSGVYHSEEDTLEDSQRNKIERLLGKLQLRPEHHLLEIGSGWGGLAMHAVRSTGCRVTTITLSKEQKALAEQRIAAAGLQDRITVLLKDYRDLEGQFDRIVSVEMLEAVGEEYFGTFFATLDRVMKPDGMAAVQVITMPESRYEEYRRGCDWIQKYIFPGALLPSVNALTQAMARNSRLTLEHAENIGIHYATTLRQWRVAFHASKARVLALGFDERFLRMWDYYLCYCEAGFQKRLIGNHQLLFTRSNNANLPTYAR